jgi:hypothetical protein
LKKALLSIAVIAALAACRNNQPAASVTKAVPQPAAEAAGPKPATLLTGRVMETLDAAGYTYVRLSTNAGERWAAVRETKLENGVTVSIEPQMVAPEWESSTLGRKFENLTLGSISGHDPGTPSDHISADAGPAGVKAAEANGTSTIAEIWAAKSSLKGQRIVVRGEVVKFSGRIMGKHWVHVRDGSGKRADRTDDITITTEDVAAVGDVVTVQGTLNTDRDFGSGYVYAVIVEDATLRK